MLDGHIGSMKTHEESIVLGLHPAVEATGLIVQNLGQWKPGLVLTRDAEERLCPWDGSGKIAGVLTDHVDSTGQASANYLLHGCIRMAVLHKKDQSLLSFAEINLLAESGIYGV